VAMPGVWGETDERGGPGRLGTTVVSRISALGLLQRASVIRVQFPCAPYSDLVIFLCDSLVVVLRHARAGGMQPLGPNPIS
jgi:hypothetical protein